ncbi:MAG: hypothetical protein HWN66_16560, partial [Candidatus Helarchaeota archaeon]|nr:hypothetical protein [Candidatus Helarchaeota archaeon]
LQGILLVFDLTRKKSMDKLKDWILEAAKNAGGTIKAFYLIGNKSDLPEREVNMQEAQEFATFLADRLKFPIPYIETSAKTGENIKFLFLDLCRYLLMKEGLEIPEISKEGEEVPPPGEPAETAETMEAKSIPESSGTSVTDSGLSDRVSVLEKKVNQLEEIIKKIAQLLKDSL